MEPIELAKPEQFRDMLRRVLRRTVPLFAASGLAMSCGTVPSISPKDDLLACPAPTCSTSTNLESKTGSFLHLLSQGDGKPLSKEQCIQACMSQLNAKCPPNSDPDEQLLVTHFQNEVTDCKEVTSLDGKRGVDCSYKVTRNCGVVGRRPLDMHEFQRPDTVSTEHQLVGAFFAELAYLEEAAVTAFDYLTRELEAYNAPRELIALSQRAMKEEVEHAEMMGELARRYGASTQPVVVEPFVLRPLADIAYENAKEGCIREAYGSLMAMWQSYASEDPAVRAVMERIAYEESEHAALSYGIDAWIQPQLSADEQETCQQILAESFAGLQQEIQESPSDALVRWAGYPTPQVGLELLQQLEQECSA
ncbi:MAG: ferritin-like domain-containing protein [Deltaproteobacteria bacterium]|nr:MAG: ferritin-like domain-containing protein [Deltaproteobacteria bacterium]